MQFSQFSHVVTCRLVLTLFLLHHCEAHRRAHLSGVVAMTAPPGAKAKKAGSNYCQLKRDGPMKCKGKRTYKKGEVCHLSCPGFMEVAKPAKLTCACKSWSSGTGGYGAGSAVQDTVRIAGMALGGGLLETNSTNSTYTRRMVCEFPKANLKCTKSTGFGMLIAGGVILALLILGMVIRMCLFRASTGNATSQGKNQQRPLTESGQAVKPQTAPNPTPAPQAWGWNNNWNPGNWNYPNWNGWR
mmetsp:Transcript_99211/g.156398  ORF Transcript_99211/g.156398 Transcript_99211/m.156398 type:complete len:243 (+) Transcript_99211:81-809(+)